MTVLPTVRANLLDRISTQLPAVQVLGAPPAENQSRKEAVWVERAETVFEFDRLGPITDNRREEVLIELHLHVYREGADQIVVADEVVDRTDELLGEIEAAVTADDHSLGIDGVTAKVSRGTVRLLARESGWAGVGQVTVEATKRPG